MISDQQSPAFEEPTLQAEGFQDVFNLWAIGLYLPGFQISWQCMGGCGVDNTSQPQACRWNAEGVSPPHPGSFTVYFTPYQIPAGKKAPYKYT